MDNIEFDLFKNPSKADENETGESYHVRISNSQTINLKGLVDRIHNSCSMTPSDVHGVLVALKDEISNALAHGQQVNIDGLCRFRLILGSKESSKCFGKEDGHDIGFKKIKISPYKEFNEETKKNTESRPAAGAALSRFLKGTISLGGLADGKALRPVVGELLHPKGGGHDLPVGEQEEAAVLPV